MKHQTLYRKHLMRPASLFILFFLFISLPLDAQRRINPHIQNPQLCSGYYSSHAIINGQLWGWGYNDGGEIGNGNSTQQNTPVRIGTDNNWLFIDQAKSLSQYDFGSIRSVGLKTDGSIWAWGQDFQGTNNTTTPNYIGKECKKVSVGPSHNLLIMSDGTLWGWGYNWNNQLAGAPLSGSQVPVSVDTDRTWVDIATSDNCSYGIKANGTLWSWGANDYGQLGNGSTIPNANPTQIGNDHDWISVEAGAGFDTYAFAIKADGTLWAWGQNSFGSLGIGNNTDQHSPVKINTDQNWVSVKTSGIYTCALKANGTLWYWGGVGSSSINTPLQFGSASDWVSASIDLGGSIIAAKANGTVWGLGFNGFGDLGDGTTTDRSTPVQILSSITTNSWKMTASGTQFTVGLKSDGSLWSWGDNTYGQLGVGNTTYQTDPTRIGTDNDWTYVATGDNHTLAIKANGTLWLWGDNTYSQLGNGNSTTQTSPVQIGIDRDWISISGGNAHSMALKANGSLFIWGSSSNGQFGNGSTTSSNVPLQIGSEKWIAIAAGSISSYGIKANGTLWSTGYNGYGELGNNTTTNSTSFIVAGAAEEEWTAVSAGYHFTMALRARGTLWAFGANGSGQLGVGTLVSHSSPVRIGDEEDAFMIFPVNPGSLNLWRFIAASKYNTSYGIRTDGTLWTWGSNSGQYGNGNYTTSKIPLKIGTDNTWRHISGANFYTIGIKSYRTQYCGAGNGPNFSVTTYTCY